MLETEDELGDMTEHMLMAVWTRYGKSSVEYGMAGREEFLRTSAAKGCEASRQLSVMSNRHSLPLSRATMEIKQQRSARICASTQNSVKWK